MMSKGELIWSKFIASNEEFLNSVELPLINGDEQNTIAMVEPRSHPYLGFVFRNALRFLGEGWGIDIFVGKHNRSFVIEALSDLGQVNVHNLNVDDLNVLQYNTLKKQPHIWESIQAENILWVEPDCLICRSGIDEFLHYDFIGAPWHKDFAISPKMRVGNGGLSLRKRSTMLDIATNANTSTNIYLSDTQVP